MSSYVPTDWANGVTPLDEAHLDKIEQGVFGAYPKSITAPVSSDPADVALPASFGTTVVLEATGTGGKLRSVQADQVALGARLTIRCGATGPVVIKHNYAGSPPAGYAKFLTLEGADLTLAANSGQTATFYFNGVWWTELTRNTGASGGGGGLDWEGAWAAGTAYVKGDVVTKDGVVYGAVNDSTGQTPPPASPQIGVVPIPLVTTLPASPFDGQEVILTDSLTVPTYTWRLRYVAGVTDAYKWVFVGGSPAFSEVQANEGTNSTAAYVDLATVGPGITVPRAGIYRAQFNAEGVNDGNGASWVAIKRGVAATQDADSAVTQAGTNNLVPSIRDIRMTVAAGDLLKLQYKVSGGTTNFRKRELRVTPVRVA